MNCGHKHPVRTHSFASWKTSDYFTRVTQVDIRRIGSICRRVARQFSQNDFTNSLPNGTTPDSCPSSEHHSKPTSEQRITAPSSRPTSEQRNTAPSSKTDEQAAEHRAIVEGRRTSSGSPRAIVDSKGTTPDSIRRAYPIENLNSNF